MAFFKEDWIPFVCSTDVSIAISSTKVAIRTRGDGHWKKYTYQDSAFSITLSGLLKFDDDNWTGWDMIDNQFNFSHVLVRCSFNDENGNIRTLQGYVMIETSTISYAPGTLVKDDFQLQGNGKLDMFDGYIPCASIITEINVAVDDSGNTTITYTFTGDLYQVKYRLNGVGDYAYALGGMPIVIPTLSLGTYEIEVIPVCPNNYEGTGDTRSFIVTLGHTCPSVITDITIASLMASNTHTGAATQMKYRIDGGAWTNALITASIDLSGLPVGDHSIEEVPLCQFGIEFLEGTGFIKIFTVTVAPALSRVDYDFTTLGTGSFKIYVNGVLNISATSDDTGFINVPVGASVRGFLSRYPSGADWFLKTFKNGGSLDIQINPLGDDTQYTFVTDGSNYSIEGHVDA